MAPGSGEDDGGMPAGRDLARIGASPVAGPVRRALVRLVAYGLPALVAIVGVAEVNLWPATGWRLFSTVRAGTEATWVLDATTAEGEARRHHPGSLGSERRSWRHLLDGAVDDPARRDELCREWLGEAVELDPAVTSLMIRRAVVAIPRRDGQPSPVVWDRVVTACHR